ncbi:MAG: hypothetical protein IJP44_08530 [Bacteroidales bacterium]|nr:hypothetical protein [Bacteroidales bacterium]
MTSLFLISALLLALAVLRGSAGRRAARGALWGNAMPNSTIMLPTNHAFSGGGSGRRPPSPTLQTLGKNRFTYCRPCRRSCAPSAGARPKAGCGALPRKARRWLGGSLCRMGKSTINYKTTF